MNTHKNYSQIVYCSICILFCSIGCHKRIDINTEIKNIKVADSTWFLAINDKDIEVVMSFYDEHAIWRHTNGPALQGKNSIFNLWSDFFENQEGILDWSIQHIEISESGKLASCIGFGRVTYKNEVSEIIESDFDFVTIWKKDDKDEWKLAIDISSYIN